MIERQSLSQPQSPQPNAILNEEIRILRERGLSEDCIHGLLGGFNIDARSEPSGPAQDHWKTMLNDQLIRLIWGPSAPVRSHAD